MSWKEEKILVCGDCNGEMKRKNPKPAKDGILRCKTCATRHSEDLFVQKHGVSVYEKYMKGNISYKRRSRDCDLRREYGINIDQYDLLYSLREGKCDICGLWFDRLVVDHDHSTGAFRGLLCQACNRVLGVFKDDETRFASAILYLSKRKAGEMDWKSELPLAWKGDDIDGLRWAYRIAAEDSTDPSTQNGALIVRNGTVVCGGANKFPEGVKETAERWQRPQKYMWVEHSERNAIFSAIRNGQCLEGSTMYVCWAACADCARAIIQSGIRTVIAHEHEYQLKQVHWLEQIKISDEMLKEAGVNFSRVKGKVGGVKIRFGGELIEP